MADAGALTVVTYRVEHGEGFSVPLVQLRNRRVAAQPAQQWIFQRTLEWVLFGRRESSSGPIWKILQTLSMESTTLQINKAAVTSNLITQQEHDQLMRLFKQQLTHIDPSSLGRIRTSTLLPLPVAAAVCRSFGRSPGATAFLTSFSQPIPEAWGLLDQRDANDANMEEDLALNEQIDELNFEVEETTFAEELVTSMVEFKTDPADDDRMKTYVLQQVRRSCSRPPPPLYQWHDPHSTDTAHLQVSRNLKHELDAYLVHRTSTFAARRQGGAVLNISAEADKTHLLRFLGYLDKTNRTPDDAPLEMTMMIRADVGDMVQAYAMWLRDNQRLKYSSIANYLSG